MVSVLGDMVVESFISHITEADECRLAVGLIA